MKLRAFGAMREFANEEGFIVLNRQAATVKQLRELLGDHLTTEFASTFSPSLLASCVFANDERLLGDDEPVQKQYQLAVLPPVAGG